jgi:hypothetical protein
LGAAAFLSQSGPCDGQLSSEKPGVGRCVPAIDSNWRTISIADAHRGDGKRFVVRTDETLTAFVELERQVLTVTFYLASIS